MIFIFIRVLGHSLELFDLGKHKPFHQPNFLAQGQDLVGVLAQWLGPSKGVPKGASSRTTIQSECID